ncbi:hypothetical protein H5T51_01640 [Candidatus Bathyarchaeota archaeon]|nr:hypothetical protein [Candidatus Bathyarchaeota archaeon]
MAKFSRPFLIYRRILKLEEKFHADTQRLRGKLMQELENIFDEACRIAKGEVKIIDEREVTMKQRQMWARIAAYTAQVMQGIAKGFDEREIDEQLKELRRLVDEAKAKSGADRAA